VVNLARQNYSLEAHNSFPLVDKKKHLSYKNQIFITVFEIGIHSTYPEPDESLHFALF
jgi:hypothetical protein